MATLKPLTRIETEFTLFKNTPFVDYQNTLIFKSNEDRDRYFNSFFEKKEFKQPFNFVMDKSTIKIPNTRFYDYYTLLPYNYLTFIDNVTKKRIYAFITDIEYINSGVTEIRFLIDGIMTYCQGRVLEGLQPITIERQHLTKASYSKYLNEIKNNDDIIQVHTNNYFFDCNYNFKDFICLILSSSDLTADFGTVKDPKMQASRGGTFDRISSPLDLYAVDQKNFNDFSSKLKKYPWIAQNIKSVFLVPKDIMKLEKQFSKVTTHFNFNNLYRAKNNLNSDSYDTTTRKKLNDEIGFTYKELLDLYNLKEGEDDHLLRNGYMTLEGYGWNGQQLQIDLSKIDKNGLKWELEKILGYENEIAIYPKNYNYKSDNKTWKGQEGRSYTFNPNQKGSYLNNAIFINNFDTVPVLVDNYNLSLAKNANKRQLAEDKLITNRLRNIGNDKASLQSRFFDSASVLSNLSPRNLLGKFNDEYEFYRSQQAEFKDMALTSPSINEQSTGNAFQVKANNFGLNLKFAKPDDTEIEKIKTYYKAYGYELNRVSEKIDDVFSMSVCNYLRVKGNYHIKGVPVPIMETIRIQLENGVRLWHNTNTSTPFTGIERNKIIGV